MIELLTGCVVVGLFSWGLTEVVHHGSIFEMPRAYLEVRGGKLGELASCAFCKSFWAALAGSALVTLSKHYIPTPSAIASFIVMTYAGMRLANLFSDLSHGITRMHDPEFGDEGGDDEPKA